MSRLAICWSLNDEGATNHATQTRTHLQTPLHRPRYTDKRAHLSLSVWLSPYFCRSLFSTVVRRRPPLPWTWKEEKRKRKKDNHGTEEMEKRKKKKKKGSGKVAAPPAHVATPAADASTSVEEGSSPIPALFIFSPSTISFLYLIYSYLTYRRHHPCRRCQP